MPIWTYWQLKELQKLAEFLNSKCLDEKQKSINNICIFMTEENFNKMNHMMSMPHGIIYVTGPT